MGQLAGFKYREVAKKLERLGWAKDREAKGSHVIWRRSSDGRKITLVNHVKDIPEGLLRAILRQAEIVVTDFLQA